MTRVLPASPVDFETQVTHVAYDADHPTDRGDFLLMENKNAHMTAQITDHRLGGYLVTIHDTQYHHDLAHEQHATIWAALDGARIALGIAPTS